MNYLAHLYFGRKSDASLVGNFLGDFAKGTEEALREQYPGTVVDGIIMHRKIDKFTDQHKVFLEAKILLSSNIAKFSGIIIDTILDHFLAKHWDKYGEGRLETFVERSHKVLKAHPDWHSEELSKRLPLIIGENVLLGYQEKEGVQHALNAISKRAKFDNSIADGYDDFLRNYSEFELIFHELFPIIKNYAATLAPSAELKESQDSDLSDDDLILMWRQHAIVMSEKGFRIESLIGHFTSKGVSEEAAKEVSASIMEKVELAQAKLRKLLIIPGIVCLAIVPLLWTAHWIIPHPVLDAPARNFFAGILSGIIGYIFLGKAKSVR